MFIILSFNTTTNTNPDAPCQFRPPSFYIYIYIDIYRARDNIMLEYDMAPTPARGSGDHIMLSVDISYYVI